jgi:arylsulfatase A
MLRVKLMLLLYVLCALATGQARAASRPNIVLFLVDDLGWTDWQQDAKFNPTGSVVYETPHLLRLAKSGQVFRNAYAACPVCSPTRAAILTGKNPARLRLTDWIPGPNVGTAKLTKPNWQKNLATSEVTLAEALRAGGYVTGFFGKWHLGERGSAADPTQNGFDVNIGGGPFGSPTPAGGYIAGGDGCWTGFPGLDAPGAYPADKSLSDALTERAGEFIQQNTQQPFFLMLSHYHVHTPLEAPADLKAKYQQKIDRLQSQGVELQDHTNPTYAAMIEKMDQSLGELLDRLEDPNGDGDRRDSVRANTLICFASDNGGLWSAEGSPTRNLPLREGKGSMYEGGIRTPLIVSWSGNAAVAPGVVTKALSASPDLFATALDVAGLSDTAPATIDGVSLRTALEGRPFDRGELYWHYPHLSNQDQGSEKISGGAFVSAVRKDNWKLIYFYEDERYELYDLAADESETTNSLAAQPTIADELTQALRAYLLRVDAQFPVSRATGLPVEAPR